MDLLPVQVPLGTVKIGDVVCTWQTRKRGPSVVVTIGPEGPNPSAGRMVTLLNGSNRTRSVSEHALMSYAAVVFNQYAEFEGKFTALQAFTKKVPLLLARKGVSMPIVVPVPVSPAVNTLLGATPAMCIDSEIPF